MDFLHNVITSQLYIKARSIYHRDKFRSYDLKEIVPIKVTSEKVRINLVLPHFDKTSVYGGITTALKVFDNICNKLNSDRRIIVTENDVYNKGTYNVDGMKHNDPQNGLFFIAENKHIEIGANDYFIFTSWKTAYLFYKIYEWQIKEFNLVNRKYIYLIQDYEPGFVPWSSDFILSESTYKHFESTIAIFNSKELHSYFSDLGYHFFKEFDFEPEINSKLKEKLINEDKYKKRKKQILVYGRPLHARNAFELIYASLYKWSKEYKDSSEWSIVSLGDIFSNVKLHNNTIQFKGKMSLEEYAKVMLESYMGISLMISPHPSYPPLEMSTFGVRTITNSFNSKNLSDFSENIISLSNITPDDICTCISRLCNEYDEHISSFSYYQSYINGGDFINMMEDVCSYLEENFK